MAIGNQRDSWPAWATAPIELAPPDPDWAREGVAVVAELTAALATWLRDGVHHIGSTAVPGLAAKPIIDLMAGVHDLACAPDVAQTLAPAGWHYVPPELDQRSWRRFFVKVRGDRRVAHLHLMDAAHPRWRAQLLFRDRLREDEQLREQYSDLKRQLCRQFGDDREAYSHAKAEFVADVVGSV